MIKYDIFIARLRENRCIKNNFILNLNEEEKKYISEREIHLYIFLFWENLIWDTTTIRNLKKENFFYEGQKISSNRNPNFQDNLLPHISNNCDLIYYNNENYTIELIEIKNVDLDDRAISQIQRYYRNTNLVCETYQHNLKIVNLKPTLIIRHKNIINDKKNQSNFSLST